MLADLAASVTDVLALRNPLQLKHQDLQSRRELGLHPWQAVDSRHLAPRISWLYPRNFKWRQTNPPNWKLSTRGPRLALRAAVGRPSLPGSAMPAGIEQPYT